MINRQKKTGLVFGMQWCRKRIRSMRSVNNRGPSVLTRSHKKSWKFLARYWSSTAAAAAATAEFLSS